MKIVQKFDELSNVLQCRGVFLAIGVFDGVHIGHQRVIGRACEEARAANACAIALTFDPHPMRVLQPDRAPLLLTSTEHKLALMQNLGLAATFVMKFDDKLAATEPEDFLKNLARGIQNLRAVCVGSRFRFGHKRAGDVALMKKLSAELGFEVHEIESVRAADGEIVSSTAIRQHVLAGNLQKAAQMLGRRFSILGTVEKGDNLGRKLGFPTANLNPHNEIMPPDGVYVAEVAIENKRFGGVINIGMRPTFADRSHRRVLEVHIFDFDREIYGEDIEIFFIEKLRDEKKFGSLDELRAQIGRDALKARSILES
jgi:riboflavin kinase/FMN adenylyltransferase